MTMRRPGLGISEASVFVAVLLLYTNLPVVAAQRGMLPYAVAVVVPLLLAVAVANQIVVWRRGVVVDRTLFLMTGLLAVFLLTTFSAEGHEVATDRMGTYVMEGMLIYFLVRNAVRTLPDLQGAIKAMLIAATLLSGLAMTQAVTGNYEQEFLGLAQRNLEHLEGEPTPIAPREEMGLEDRARGPVNDPNRFAQILLIAAPFALAWSLNATRVRHTVGAGLQVALILGAVLLTYSRGALVTLVGLLLLLAPLRFLSPRRLATVLVAGVLLAPVAVPGLTDRIGSIAGVAGLFGRGDVEPDGPTRGRTTEMLAALAAYVDHPILGVGPGQYLPHYSVQYQTLPEISFRALPTPRRAHSLYLELAAEAGTVGLVLFMAIPFLLLRDLEVLRRRLYSRRPDLARWAGASILSLIGYLGTGVFLHLSYERYYWLIIGLTASAAAVLQAAADSEDASLGHGAADDHAFQYQEV